MHFALAHYLPCKEMTNHIQIKMYFKQAAAIPSLLVESYVTNICDFIAMPERRTCRASSERIGSAFLGWNRHCLIMFSPVYVEMYTYLWWYIVHWNACILLAYKTEVHRMHMHSSGVVNIFEYTKVIINRQTDNIPQS